MKTFVRGIAFLLNSSSRNYCLTVFTGIQLAPQSCLACHKRHLPKQHRVRPLTRVKGVCCPKSAFSSLPLMRSARARPTPDSHLLTVGIVAWLLGPVKRRRKGRGNQVGSGRTADSISPVKSDLPAIMPLAQSEKCPAVWGRSTQGVRRCQGRLLVVFPCGRFFHKGSFFNDCWIRSSICSAVRPA